MDGRRSITDERVATRLVLAALTFFVSSAVAYVLLRIAVGLVVTVAALLIGAWAAWTVWSLLRRPSRDDDDIDRLLRG